MEDSLSDSMNVVHTEATVHALSLEGLGLYIGDDGETRQWLSNWSQRHYRKLYNRINIVNIMLIILLVISMIIELAALGLSYIPLYMMPGGEIVPVPKDNLSWQNTLRTMTIIFAFIFTLVTTGFVVMSAQSTTIVLLLVVCVFLDAPMMAIVEGGNTLFAVGIVAVVFRIITLIVACFGLIQQQYLQPHPPQPYLQFLDDHVTGRVAKLCERVKERLPFKPGDPIDYPVARRQVATAICEVFDELYETDAEDQGHKKGSDAVTELSLSLEMSCAVPEEPGLKKREQTICHAQESGAQKHLALSMLKGALHSADNRNTCLLVVLLVSLCILTSGNVAFEFWKIFANQPQLFTPTVFADYTNREYIRETTFPNRSHSSYKVHIIVMDGLRDDFTDSDNKCGLAEYLASDEFRPYSLRFHARAQLPSFSVPNWLSILSGSPPENTGVVGNLQNKQTDFDNIFAVAKEYNINSGLTGTPWWASLVQRSLPPLGGDGTVSTSFIPDGTPTYDWKSADPADWVRGSVAVEAARRATFNMPFGPNESSVFYELFLTHLSDIDAQGHEYGIDTKWNKRDTYCKAIHNKTRILRNIVDVVDNNTILIVTSDHGHVMRGGHGGASNILRDVPVFFFRKGVSLKMPSENKNYPTDKEPRLGFEGKYSNLDFSATVTALLGCPAPRHSIGVFIAEVLQVLIPDAQIRLRHYHDLVLAKINTVQAYEATMLATCLSSLIPSVLIDKRIKDFMVNRSVFSAANASTEVEYAEMTRIALKDYHSIRNAHYHVVFYRNLIVSLVVVIPVLIVVIILYRSAAFCRMTSIFNRSHPTHHKNLIAFLLALGTVVLYVFLSIISYVIIYFAIVGQKQWDSTAFHTPSVAMRYLVAVIVPPVIYFTILTKLCLVTKIQWQIPFIGAEWRGAKKIRTRHLTRWFGSYILHDIGVFLFATSSFRAERYLQAYLYVYYLAVWMTILSIILLFACFPFTFFLPAVFSVSHVNRTTLVYKFRLVSVMFMMIPMQFGCIIMLLLRPPVNASTDTLWDLTFVNGRLVPDLYYLDQAMTHAQKQLALQGESDIPEEEEEARRRKARHQLHSAQKRKELTLLAARWLLDCHNRFYGVKMVES